MMYKDKIIKKDKNNQLDKYIHTYVHTYLHA